MALGSNFIGGIASGYAGRRRIRKPKKATYGWAQRSTGTGMRNTGPPRAPAAPGVAPIAAPKPPTLADDATAAAERAQAIFNRTQQTNDIDLQGGYDKTDFAEALRRLAVQRPRDEQTTKEGANKQGLFFSGQLGKRLDDVATNYTRQTGDAQLAYDRREAAREAARQAIILGKPIEEAAIDAANAERQVARDQAAADAGTLVPDDPVKSAAAAPRPKAKPKPKPKKKKPAPKKKASKPKGKKRQVARFHTPPKKRGY